MRMRFHGRICLVGSVLGLGVVAGCAGEEEWREPGVDDAADVDDDAGALLEAATACVRMVPVSSSGALASAVANAKPGDCIVAANGSYAGTTIKVKATADHPVVVRAASRGRAVFTSRLQLTDASYVTVEGFDYTGPANVIIDSSDHCRISRSHFKLDGGTFVSVKGDSDRNRIDHSDFGPLVNNGHLLNPTGLSTRTRIDHNHFHDVASAGGNGRETVSLGCCGATYDYHRTGNVVENNLFESCDGENEMIGIKSSNNTVRHNTIRRSRGYISLRAGRGNRIYGNYILGEGKAGTGGIRVFEDDHVIYNNYVDTEETPFVMSNGDPPGGAHAAVERVTVVYNTFVAHGAQVKVGGAGHAVPPSASVFSNNLLFGADKVMLEANPADVTYRGNIAFRTTPGSIGVDKPSDQFRVVNPRLTSAGGVLRPSASSPVVDAGTGMFSFVTDDVDGRARDLALDVGAFEASSPAARRAPLTAADVGPDAP
jgi:poly(beta-D-mannuronate) lyase